MTRISKAVEGIMDAKHKVEEANFFTKGTHVFYISLCSIVCFKQ